MIIKGLKTDCGNILMSIIRISKTMIFNYTICIIKKLEAIEVIWIQ